MKEIVTVQVQVAVEYNEKREGARDNVLKYATALHIRTSGCDANVGFYSARIIEGSGEVVSLPHETE